MNTVITNYIIAGFKSSLIEDEKYCNDRKTYTNGHNKIRSHKRKL